MKDKIIKILVSIRPEFDFTENVDFIKQGMLDSFDVVNLVTTLDEEFDISIDGIDIVPDNFATIDGIIALLKKNGVNQ